MKPLDRTPGSGHLCTNCKFYHVRRFGNGSMRNYCGHGISEIPITQTVDHCTDYHPKSMPFVSDYEDMAWVWTSDEEGKPAFVRMRDNMRGNYIPVKLGFTR